MDLTDAWAWQCSDKTLLVAIPTVAAEEELKSWNPAACRKEFLATRLGKHLVQHLLKRKWRIQYTYASVKVPNSPACLASRLKATKPTAVLALGTETKEEALKLCKGATFCVPYQPPKALPSLLVEGVCRHITDFGIFHDNPQLREALYSLWEINIVKAPAPRLEYIQTIKDYKVVNLLTGGYNGDLKGGRRTGKSAGNPSSAGSGTK
jgi:hypothetical protein